MFKIFISVVLLITYVSGQRPFYIGLGQKPVCVNDGDYCQQNIDCCSNSCLNATSRCANSTSTTPSANATPTRMDDVNLPQQNQTLAERFGEEQSCRSNEDFCRAGQDCCSKTCLNAKCVDADESKRCRTLNQKCSSSESCCTFLQCDKSFCVKSVGVLVQGTETFGYQEGPYLPNRFGEGESSTTATALQGKCMDIGGKCYVQTDCCVPLKCHGFLHQCVT